MKKLLFFLTTALLALSVSAAPVNLNTAMNKAQSFLKKELYAGKMMSPAATQPVLLKAEMGKTVNQPVYYIFNTATTFIVVAGDDRADEILMIGDQPLPDVNLLPPGLQDMLGQYKDQISYLQENPTMEANLMADPVKGRKASVTGTYGPLLTCNWDQEAPYYNQCKFGSYQ